ncbi:hypothetical protein BX600DRAFT_504060 [Xylariales sp. PMI_506]|nr:hypothetical protein BX600DRAFT_504060 [Xylariales sp. PMI_506]
MTQSSPASKTDDGVWEWAQKLEVVLEICASLFHGTSKTEIENLLGGFRVWRGHNHAFETHDSGLTLDHRLAKLDDENGTPGLMPMVFVNLLQNISANTLACELQSVPLSLLEFQPSRSQSNFLGLSSEEQVISMLMSALNSTKYPSIGHMLQDLLHNKITSKEQQKMCERYWKFVQYTV